MLVADHGMLLGGRYRLDQRIAFGGMGQVWLSSDELLGRPVAVKVLRAEYASDEKFRRRLRAEARAAARLSHPRIASVYDYGEQTDEQGDCVAFIVMQYVDGQPLSDVLARQGRLAVSELLDLVGQAADALGAAHAQGVVHRDVKPANLLRRGDGALVITDFGIARAAEVTSVTETGSTVGTPHYMAPEQIEGREVGPAADLYALGVVAYEGLTGRRPFEGETSMAVAYAHLQREPDPLPPDVPPPVSELVSKLLDKDPDRRPSSASSVAGEAAVIQASLSGPPTVRQEITASGRRRGWIWPAAALAALAFVLVPGGWLWASSRGGRLPSVIGMRWDAARPLLARAGLQPIEQVKDALDAPAGAVVGEEPHAGARVAPRSTVLVTVASGWEDLDPARFVGQPYAQVAGELKAVGLHAVRRQVPGAPSGRVVRVNAGRVAYGSQVTVDVGSGGVMATPAASRPPARSGPTVAPAPAPTSSSTTSTTTTSTTVPRSSTTTSTSTTTPSTTTTTKP